MRIFAGPLGQEASSRRSGMQEGEAIESRMVTRRIEARSEEGRRTQLRDSQEPARIRRSHGRAAEAGLQLSPTHPRRRQLPQLILDMIEDQVEHRSGLVPRIRITARMSFAAWAGNSIVDQLRSRVISAVIDFRRGDASMPWMKPSGMAETQILDAIEENLPEDEDASGMELGSAGQVGQHAVGPEPSRSRFEESRPRRRC